MDVETLYGEIVKWVRDSVFSTGGKGGVFGLSGGLDSSVVGVLCQKAFGQDCLGVSLPCYSSPEDREHAEILANSFNIPFTVITLDTVFDEMMFQLQGGKDVSQQEDLSASNIKPRLRMVALYYIAAKHGYRVIGTGNKSEILLGYFTKYGDSAVDLEPLGDLLKEEVYELADYLQIPREIIDKKPSAGLWSGQTDEEEMGFTYGDLDEYLKGNQVDPALKEKIEFMIKRSEHKRHMPPLFKRGDNNSS